MSDDQVGCEWVSISSGTGLPGLSRTKAVKRLCVCVCVLLLSQQNRTTILYMGRPNVSYVTNRLKVSIGGCLNFVLITLDRCDSFSQTDGGKLF